MPEVGVTLTQEELFSQYAEQSAIAEANRYRVVESGSYVIQAKKYEGKVFPPSTRPIIRIQAEVKDNTDKKVGTIFFGVSNVTGRTDKGDLDKSSKLYGQLTKALYPEKNDSERARISVGDLMTAVMQYPVKAYITKSYLKTENGQRTYLTPRTTEDEKLYKEAGYEPVNFVQNISKA